jgi:hypothetical protein
MAPRGSTGVSVDLTPLDLFALPGVSCAPHLAGLVLPRVSDVSRRPITGARDAIAPTHAARDMDSRERNDVLAEGCACSDT